MKLYLINKNPMINKLVDLSASKLEMEMVESQEIDASINAEIMLMDDECFDAESFLAYKAANAETKMVLFYAKAAERIKGFDAYIQKPFLPTDLVKTLSEVSAVGLEQEIQRGVDSDILELESDDLGALDLAEGLDFSNLEDLDLDDDVLQGETTKTQKQSNPQILDKSDVDTIKDLLEETTGDTAAAQQDGKQGNAMDALADVEETFDFSLDDIMNPEEEAQSSAELDTKEEEQNTQEFDLDVLDIEDDKHEEAEAVENSQSQISKGQEEDTMEDLNLDADVIDEEKQADVGNKDLESSNAEDLNVLEAQETNANKEQIEEEKVESAMDLSDLGLEDIDTSLETNAEDLDLDSLMAQSTTATDNLENNDLKGESLNGLEDLSLEDMGEALGEPIQKEPIPTPLVAQESPANDSPNAMQGSLQAHSLDSLINALQTLQTQALKDLLSGATISINIQFPKKDEKE